MEKIEVKIDKTETSFSFAGYKIKVNPIIEISNMGMLRDFYLSSLFKKGIDSEWDEQLAEFMFRRGVLDLQTNIELTKFSKIEELDILVWGELYKEVSSRIINYLDVYNSVKSSVEHEVEKYKISNSTGKVLSGIISYLSGVLEEFKNVKPEDIEKMKKEASSLLEQIKESPISEVLSEVKKEKRIRKKKENVEHS